MIYVVGGYMRSGTSMMCQALEAGGMTVARSTDRDIINNAGCRPDYRPNPVSLYELDPHQLLEKDWIEQRDGQTVKIIAPFLQYLAPHDYDVIFMRRPTAEIVQSFYTAFRGKLTPAKVEADVARSLATWNNRKDVRNIRIINFADVVAAPAKIFSTIDWPFDAAKAAAVVDPSLYRCRGE